MNLEYNLWRIKHWLQYQPSIFFYRFLAKFSYILYEISDRLGYLLFGKVRWEELKKENIEEE